MVVLYGAAFSAEVTSLWPPVVAGSAEPARNVPDSANFFDEPIALFPPWRPATNPTRQSESDDIPIYLKRQRAGELLLPILPEDKFEWYLSGFMWWHLGWPPSAGTTPKSWQATGIRDALGVSDERFFERSPAVREEALNLCVRYGWGEILDPHDVAPLLASHRISLKWDALWAVRQMGAKAVEVQPEVTELLYDSNSHIRDAAREELEEMASHGAIFSKEIAAKIRSEELPVAVIGKILMVDDAEFAVTHVDYSATAKDVVVFLQDRRAEVRGAAARILGWSGDLAEPFSRNLIPLLSEPAPEVREAAVCALGETARGNFAVGKEASALIDDPNRDVRSAAVRALGAIGAGTSKVDKEIARALRDEDGSVRFAALEVVADLENRGANLAAEVAELLDDVDAGVRESAAIRLGEMGGPGAAFAREFSSLLEDRDGLVRSNAARALGKMGRAAADHVGSLTKMLSDDTDARAGAVTGLAELAMAGVSVESGVSNAIKRANSEQRAAIATAIGSAAPGVLVFAPQLVSLLRDEDPAVRRAAVEALGRLGAPVAKEAAVLLNDEKIRGTAIVALANMGADGAAFESDFIKFLEIPGVVDDEEISAIGKLGHEGFPVPVEVAKLLKSPKPEVRRLAAKAISASGEAGAPFIKELSLLLSDEPYTRLTAALAIDQLGNPDGDLDIQANFLAAAYTKEEDELSAYRAHLRLWSRGDANLQQLVTWLGRPDVEPMPKDSLTADEARETLGLFLRFWNHTAACPQLRKELSDRIVQVARAVAGKADAETSKILGGLATKLKDAPNEAENLHAVEEAIGPSAP